MSKYVFHVYVNYVRRYGDDCVIPATKRAAKAWIKQYVLSTHMGEWHRCEGGSLEYATTTGLYIGFQRERVRVERPDWCLPEVVRTRSIEEFCPDGVMKNERFVYDGVTYRVGTVYGDECELHIIETDAK